MAVAAILKSVKQQ